jgi:hypothetical protein
MAAAALLALLLALTPAHAVARETAAASAALHSDDALLTAAELPPPPPASRHRLPVSSRALRLTNVDEACAIDVQVKFNCSLVGCDDVVAGYVRLPAVTLARSPHQQRSPPHTSASLTHSLA